MPDERNELIQSFYLPAPGVAEEMSVMQLDPAPDNADQLELVVISGGPVFMFDGRVDGAKAYRRTRGIDTTDFDLASNGNARSAMGIRQRYGSFTVAADVETIGYVRCYRKG